MRMLCFKIPAKIALTVFLFCMVFYLAGCGFNSNADSETTSSSDDTMQNEADLSSINQWREDYDLGTCRKLEGNVSVILFYIDDFESRWTEAEIDRFTKNEVMPGLAFLEQEAKKYGIELNLTVQKSYSGIYYDDEVITSVKNMGLASADVLWQAALQTNYSSTEKMIHAFRHQYHTEEVVCFTLFNKAGTSYALNPKKGSTVKIDEHCIVFARDLTATQNGPDGYQASVVAHEMLHLFGAEDFYASASRKSLAKIHYPDDIMLSAAYDIDKNTVDAATAFYIGWIHTVPEVLRKNGW